VDFLPVAGSIAKMLEKGKNLVQARKESYENQEKSLEQMRRELREEFKNLSAPIVVVVDDIDRLTEDEINLVFRLVKANADFPNRPATPQFKCSNRTAFSSHQ
jgi:predicted KAP-like P-loop ATPase